MFANILYIIPVFLVTVWAFSYFCCHGMSLRWNVRYPVLCGTTFLSVIAAVIIPLVFLITKNHAPVSIPLQASLFLFVLLFFRQPIQTKLFAYFTFLFIFSIVEITISNVSLIYSYLTSPNPQVTTGAKAFSSIYALFVLLGLEFILIYIVLSKYTSYIWQLYRAVQTRFLVQLILPIAAPFILSSILFFQASDFKAQFFLYLLLYLVFLPYFFHTIAQIHRHEKESIIYEEKLKILKQQLSYIQELETEYQELRKWNHDIENHLQALSYLIDMRQFEEAEKYYQRIISKEPLEEQLHENYVEE